MFRDLKDIMQTFWVARSSYVDRDGRRHFQWQARLAREPMV